MTLSAWGERPLPCCVVISGVPSAGLWFPSRYRFFCTELLCLQPCWSCIFSLSSPSYLACFSICPSQRRCLQAVCHFSASISQNVDESRTVLPSSSKTRFSSLLPHPLVPQNSKDLTWAEVWSLLLGIDTPFGVFILLWYAYASVLVQTAGHADSQ